MFLNFFLESKVIILNYMQIKTHALAHQSTSTCIQLFNVRVGNSVLYDQNFTQGNFFLRTSHKEI
jgi:hypothetical protein